MSALQPSLVSGDIGLAPPGTCRFLRELQLQSARDGGRDLILADAELRADSQSGAAREQRAEANG